MLTACVLLKHFPFQVEAERRGRRKRSGAEGIQLPLVPPRLTPPAMPDRDRLPEHTDYKDTGCGVYHACLSCPLMTCVFDLEDAELDGQTVFRLHRDRLLYRRYREERVRASHFHSISTVAAEFALGIAQTQRIVARLKRRPEALEGKEDLL